MSFIIAMWLIKFLRRVYSANYEEEHESMSDDMVDCRLLTMPYRVVQRGLKEPCCARMSGLIKKAKRSLFL